jgi:hypothetical protein
MDADVFRTRVAPLLDPDTLRALRCVDHSWQWIVDQLVAVKGALGLRRWDKLTAADVRYKHANVASAPDDWPHFLWACVAGELTDLRWALKTFHAPDWLGEALKRVSRAECMELLVRECGVDVDEAFRESCSGGHLGVAKWLASTFNLTADDARADDNYALRHICEDGHLAEAEWLVSTFNLTANDARADENYALRCSFLNRHLAVAQWLVATFSLTADDVRASSWLVRREGNWAKWLFESFGIEEW